MTHTFFFIPVLLLLESFAVRIEAQEAVAPGGDCEYEGSTVCNGAVTVEKGKFVEICLNGKLKNKLVRKVKKGFPLVGRDTGPGKDCVWYGTVYCDGDVIQDLNRWWFLMKCSRSRFSVFGRSYLDVVSDKRYKKKSGR
eukprot:GFUD01081177.1.p1 GENE.GFUD01081177.1~~GFUD01081177.1.p1  ORF type:complete len:139 (+),score=40.83 GFUD01081177.1:51-467(+)